MGSRDGEAAKCPQGLGGTTPTGNVPTSKHSSAESPCPKCPSADGSYPTQNQGPSHLGRPRMSWLRVLALCTKSKHAGLSCAVLRHESSLGCPTCSWMRVSLSLWVIVPSSEVGRTTMPPRVWYGGRSDEHRALAHSMSIVQVNSLLNLL